jgi:hypothetical protein
MEDVMKNLITKFDPKIVEDGTATTDSRSE